MPVIETLELDASDALSAIETIGSSLEQVAETFKVGLADALDTLSTVVVGEADTTAVAESITTSIDEGSATPVVVEADASAVTAEIDTAIAGADTLAEITADASDVADEITAAVADADTTVELEAVVDSAGVEELKDDLEGVGAAGTTAAGGLGDLTGSAAGLTTGIALARGETGNFVTGLTQLSPAIAGAGAGALAFGAGLAVAFDAGLKSVAGTERLTLVFGEFASEVTDIDIGGLTGSLADLAIQSGSSGAQLKQAAASAGLLAQSAGLSTEESAKFAEQLSAIALRASVMNPALGEAGTVATQLQRALARGGARINQFNLGFLQAGEIVERATQKFGKTKDTLTSAEKVIAATELAVEHLGDQLGTDFVNGADQSVIRLRSLKAALTSSFAVAGRPLVEPIISSLEALVPLISVVTETLAVGFRIVAPAIAGVAATLEGLVTIFSVLSEGMETWQLAILGAGAAFAAFQLGLGNLVLNPVFPALVTLGVILSVIGSEAQKSKDAIAAGDATAAKATATFNSMSETLASLTAGEIGAKTATKALNEAYVELADTTLEKLPGSLEQAEADLDQLGLTHLEFGRALSGSEADMRKFVEALEREGTASELLPPALFDAIQAQQELTAATVNGALELEEITQAQYAGIKAAAQYSVSIDGVKTVFLDAEIAGRLLAEAIKVQALAAQAAEPATVGLQKSYEGVVTAATDAAKAIPGVSDALSAAIEGLGGGENVFFRSVFGDPGQLGADIAAQLNTTTAAMNQFYADTFSLSGSPALQQALLSLGPTDLGAQGLAHLAANEPFLQAGWEIALQGIQQAQLTAEVYLTELSTLFTLKAGLMGSDAATAIEKGFGKPISQLTEQDILNSPNVIATHAPALLGQVDSLRTNVNTRYLLGQGPMTEGTVVDVAKLPGAIREGKGPAGTAAGETGLHIRNIFGGEIGNIPKDTEGSVRKTGNLFPDLERLILSSQAQTAGKQVGANFAYGIRRGIDDGTGEVVAAAHRIVRAAIDEANRTAMNTSPSRVMAVTGLDMALGLAVGIDDGTSAVVAAAENIARAAADAATGTLSLATTAPTGLASNLALGGVAGATSGAGGFTIGTIQVEVNGVSDPAMAKAAGRAAADGIAEGLATRRALVGVRTG